MTDRRRERLARARLYFVTDARPPRHTLEDLLSGALQGGVDVLQLRDKEGTDQAILAAAGVFRTLCDEHGALFVLNDRPDLAVAARADGVHVGHEDVPVEQARAEAGPELLIGLSTHAPEQFDAGLRSGADYLSAGPVHSTPTKPGRPPAGLGYVRYAAERQPEKPWFAIGGIDAETIRAVMDAGAERVVVVRAIRDADDPREAAQVLRAALEEGPSR